MDLHFIRNFCTRYIPANSPLILSFIIFVNILFRLRKYVRVRVNCWFCNSNCWVHLPERNSWDCPKCEQYNGFTKDGDYNKSIHEFSPKLVLTKRGMSPSNAVQPSNGLCRICNINQQLKVTQLANFIPVNEKNFDVEIEAYKSLLEKAYELCRPCKRKLKNKLNNEKSTFLGIKLLQDRSSPNISVTDCKLNNSRREWKLPRLFLLSLSFILVLFGAYEIFSCLTIEHLNSNTRRSFQFICQFFENLWEVIYAKMEYSFPIAQYQNATIMDSFSGLNKTFLDVASYFNHHTNLGNVKVLQNFLGMTGGLVQFLCHMLHIKTVAHDYIIDGLWAVYMFTVPVQGDFESRVKWLRIVCAVGLFTIYKLSIPSKLRKTDARSQQASPRRMRNLTGNSFENLSNLDTSSESGDDVPLSKFGLDFTQPMDKINSSSSPLQNRKFSSPFVRATSRVSSSIGNGTILNSSFNENILIPQAQYHNSKMNSGQCQNMFKPDYQAYREVNELYEGINGLDLGTMLSKNTKDSNIFRLKQVDKCPPASFAYPNNRVKVEKSRPVISPSKFSHGTSWVAGGYWDSGCHPQVFGSHVASRSSSQSSGIESQTSSMLWSNLGSQPPSRENSVCSDLERIGLLHNQTGVLGHSGKYNGFFSGLNSALPNGKTKGPVHPQMWSNAYTNIPQTYGMPSTQARNRIPSGTHLPGAESFVPYANNLNSQNVHNINLTNCFTEFSRRDN